MRTFYQAATSIQQIGGRILSATLQKPAIRFDECQWNEIDGDAMQRHIVKSAGCESLRAAQHAQDLSLHTPALGGGRGATSGCHPKKSHAEWNKIVTV